MWSRQWSFSFAIFFDGIQSVLGWVFTRSRGGMDPNGEPKDGGG